MDAVVNTLSAWNQGNPLSTLPLWAFMAYSHWLSESPTTSWLPWR